MLTFWQANFASREVFNASPRVPSTWLVAQAVKTPPKAFRHGPTWPPRRQALQDGTTLPSARHPCLLPPQLPRTTARITVCRTHHLQALLQAHQPRQTSRLRPGL